MERALIFDGRCGFCTRTVQWALEHAREPFAALPQQAIDPSRYGISVEQARRTVWWIEGNLQLDGHRAVARVLQSCEKPWPAVGRLMVTPPFSFAAALGYRIVARVRSHLPGVKPACDGAWDPFGGRPRRSTETEARAQA